MKPEPRRPGVEQRQWPWNERLPFKLHAWTSILSQNALRRTEEPKGYWIADGEARPDQKVARLFIQANPGPNIDREILAEEVAFSPACQL